MTEKEKMLAGELYDCGDPELQELARRGKKLMREYNLLEYGDREGQKRILSEMLGSWGSSVLIAAPFYVDYGKFIHLGDNCEINMNCVFLDCNRINIGNNVLIAPGVHIYTVFHPVRAQDRFHTRSGSDFPFAIGLTAPVSIGDNCWIGGGSIILPGVNIGNNVTIGAGSLVTKSIPDNSLAMGSPCRVVREL